MRVSIVTETFPPEINGVAMTVGKLVEGLLDRGHETLLIRPKQSPLDLPKREPHFQEQLIAGVPLPGYRGLRFGKPALLKLILVLSRYQPDVVHVVTEGPLGWAAVVVAKWLGLPVTSSFHTNFHSYARHYGVGFLEKLTASYLRSLHNATAATFVPTKVLAAELGRYGYRNLALLSRGVDTRLFTPERRSAELRAAWGVADDELVVIHVGRLAAEKNLALILRAFTEIANKVGKAKLVLVGDGPLKDSLRGAWPETVFTGNKTGEELAAHYASGDLFLFPSVTETYGNVTSEAIASGLCVLAFDYAAAAELIDNGINGATVPLDSEQAFVTEAVRLATDTKARLAMARQARASITHLDWQYVYDAFIVKLQEMVKQHKESTLLSANANIMAVLMRTWAFRQNEMKSVRIRSDD